MASSSKLFILAFIVLVLATSKTEAQLGGLGGLGGLLGGLLGSINIKGTVFCTLDGNMGVNGTATPVFPNALVQLQCGSPGNVVSTTTTNSGGIFSIALDPLQSLLSSLLNNCSIVVKTPLSNCNVNLPSVGGLQSTLQFAGSIIQGLLNIVNIVPAGFQFLPHILN